MIGKVVRLLMATIFLLYFSPLKAIPTDNLVLSVTFNDGTANDDSGNNNNGSVNGAALTEDRFGNANHAFSFDGVNDNIFFNHSASLNISFEDYSIAAWVKAKSITNNGRIWSKGSSGCIPGYMMRMSGGEVLLEASREPGGCVTGITSGVTINDDEWHFVVAVADRDVGERIYIDGVLSASNSNNTSSFSFSNTRNPAIGFDEVAGVGSEQFNGNIDDLRIYKTALSDNLVLELFNEANPNAIPEFNSFVLIALANVCFIFRKLRKN